MVPRLLRLGRLRFPLPACCVGRIRVFRQLVQECHHGLPNRTGGGQPRSEHAGRTIWTDSAGVGSGRTLLADVPIAATGSVQTERFRNYSGSNPVLPFLHAQRVVKAETGNLPFPSGWMTEKMVDDRLDRFAPCLHHYSD